MLPMIFSALGSSMAGAGMLGALSPLIAGSLGSGIGALLQTGDIGAALRSTLTSGIAGGLGGTLMRNMGPMQGPMPDGSVVGPGMGAMGGFMGGGAAGGIGGLLQSGMQSGFQPGMVSEGTPLAQRMIQGFGQGTMTGAGLGAALGAAVSTPPPQQSAVPGATDDYSGGEPQQYQPRQYTPAPEGYAHGISPEHQFYDPQPFVPMYAEGGMVEEPNDKILVQSAIAAIRGQMPRDEAISTLGAFLQRFGEDAFRRLVDDVEEGRVPDREEGGAVEGPGDGMDDMVPAEMAGTGSDVLLSDGEFVVPADVVSGLGNGSTDAGAQQLEGMMDRVRTARTGTPEQPPQMATGGLLPA